MKSTMINLQKALKGIVVMSQ